MLQTLKDYLKITWNDEDASLSDIIERGQAYLCEHTGTDIDFGGGLARALLLDYCRYAYNNASEYFPENYREDLMLLRLKEAVKVKVVPDED